MKNYAMKPGEYTSFAYVRYVCREYTEKPPTQRCQLCAFRTNLDGHRLCDEAFCTPRRRGDRKWVYFEKLGTIKKRVRHGNQK